MLTLSPPPPILPEPHSSSHNAEPAESRSLTLLSLGFTDTQSEAEGEGIREGVEREESKRREEGGGIRIKGLWNRNKAAGVRGCATPWAQLDPKGICEVNFQTVMADLV